ncbi:MAG: hypothetical protein ACJATK_003177, partial [Paracoccaceae bacterium]
MGANSYAQTDIRVADPASLAGNGSVRYTATVQSCSSLVSLSAGSGTRFEEVNPDNWLVDSRGTDDCSYSFALNDGERLAPAIRGQRQDGSTFAANEDFVSETNSPTIEFDSVAIEGSGDAQQLIVTVSANDETDIAYLSFSVLGLNASDLTTSGGVIAEARNTAFVKTLEPQRLYPKQEGQTSYSIALPLNRVLSDQEIGFNSVVLLDVAVVDASGNQAVLSKVAFTGDSIEEKALALIVPTTPIIINNALQTPVIVPAVDFEFRGIVNLAGIGNGISYTSSHPALIGVTRDGTIYALA